MAYTPTNWKRGDVVTSEKLNKAESGISGAEELAQSAYELAQSAYDEASQGGGGAESIILSFPISQVDTDTDIGVDLGDAYDAFLSGTPVYIAIGNERRYAVYNAVKNTIPTGEVISFTARDYKVNGARGSSIARASLAASTEVLQVSVIAGTDNNGDYLEIQEKASTILAWFEGNIVAQKRYPAIRLSSSLRQSTPVWFQSDIVCVYGSSGNPKHFIVVGPESISTSSCEPALMDFVGQNDEYPRYYLPTSG